MNTTIILKALADDVRLDIVRHLAMQTKPVASTDVVKSCSEALKLSQPTLSHHLQKLEAAGVIIVQKEGRSKSYQLNDQQLKAVGINANKL
ncbi:winged helix-turn-helix transcriptional regulator [Candidatus Saccharibacteria bacterium]|nr:winged helix-turn-helix transcriptional regulator [Candidatus Saccharibacteria bacterium]